MKYCAVAVKTESGDSYVFLVRYEKPEDVPAFIYDVMCSEMLYIGDVDVDTAYSLEEDDRITQEIYNYIDSMGES